jgi:Matrixin
VGIRAPRDGARARARAVARARARHGRGRAASASASADSPPLNRVLAGLLAVLLVVLLAVTLASALMPGGPHWIGVRDGVHPALPPDAAGRPLAPPPPGPGGRGGFQVLEKQDDGTGRPVRWDPCRPIHYVIRPDGAPTGGQAALDAAITRVEGLTGLRFAFDGTTAEVPREHRPTLDGRRYGDRWSPVLVAWTDPREYPAMDGYAGLGGPDAVAGSRAGQRRYVTGVVLLNREHLSAVAGWPDGRDRMDAIVLHEFGHLVGLDHVADPGQLMYRQPMPHPGGFAAGDRRGLAELSGGPCFRDF